MVDDLGLTDGASAWSYQRFRFGLTRHAHARFSTNGGGLEWAVLPPVLALGEAGGQPVGILCGARTSTLMSRVAAIGSPVTLQMTGNADGPDAVRLTAATEGALLQAGAQVGVPVWRNAVRDSLARIRPARLPALPAGGSMPFGRDVVIDRFVVGRRHCHWETVSTAAPSRDIELLRTTRWQVRDYWLFIQGRPHRVEGQKGKFLVLKSEGRQMLRYDAASRRLRMPAICRPPLPVDQALTLCTGLPPAESLETRPNLRVNFLTYSEIPPDVAGLVGEILHQPKL